MTEIIREVTEIKMTNEITNEQVMFWARRVKAQRPQKIILDATRERKSV